MKKQAILITAYKDFEQLVKLVNEFNSNYNIYIHIDKKSRLPKEIENTLNNINIVKYIGRDYKVNWGGVNHLKCYLKLSELALANLENNYFHLITGQDFPIKSLVYFEKKIIKEEKASYDYISYSKLPSNHWENGGYDRLQYYNFYDVFNFKSKMGSKMIRMLIRFQRKLKFKRNIDDYLGELYGGDTYWSLSRNTLKYVIDFTDRNPHFLNRFKHTFCAEEFYFQTIIMNSKYSKKVKNDCLRYIDWDSGKGGYPALLDEEDYEKVINSNKLFARKVDVRSSALLKKIKESNL